MECWRLWFVIDDAVSGFYDTIYALALVVEVMRICKFLCFKICFFPTHAFFYFLLACLRRKRHVHNQILERVMMISSVCKMVPKLGGFHLSAKCYPNWMATVLGLFH